MRKLFVAALAIVGLVACMKEETVRMQGPEAISFEIGAVDKAARTRADEAADPSTTTNSIAAFSVWGFMDEPTGKVFVEEQVTKSGDKWGYTNTQYWLPKHTYYFAALSNYTNATVTPTGTNLCGLGTVVFDNAAAQGGEDLLYASTSVTLGEAETRTTPVELTFSHLLSKIKFSFTNGFVNDLATIDVKNIRMEVPAKGTIDLDVENWWDNNDWNVEGTTTLQFGDACEKLTINAKQESAVERLTIPAAQDYTIYFDVNLYYGEKLALEVKDKEVKLTGAEFQMGKAYNLAAVINADNLDLLPIEFEVIEVKEWVDAETPDQQVIETELQAAAAFGGEVTLTQDVELTKPLVISAGVTTVINLNGFDIINTTKTDAYGEGEGIVVYGDLTINGEGTVAGCTRALWARGTDGATITINGGTYQGAEDGYAKGGCSVIYASSGNTVNIYGGTFEALAVDTTSYAEDIYAVLNIADNNGFINVYGGKFLKQNPAAPGTEPKAWNTAHPNGFVADGYKTIANGDYYIVVPAEVDAVATTKEELSDALANGESTVYLPAGEYTMPSGGDFSSGDVIICEEGTVFIGAYQLNVNGATVIGATFSNPSGNAIGQTINGTMKDCVFTGKNALRYTYAGETVVFENCVFDGSTYGVHFDAGANDVIFRNCTISGFNALGAALTMVTFENCIFKSTGRSGYNGANLWGSTKMINCEFTFDGSCGTEWIDCIGVDKTYVFENCTVNGEPYSPTSYTNYTDIFSRNGVTVKINGVDCQL